MAVTRNDVDEVYDATGKISSKAVVRDITTEANQQTLQQRAQAALAANATFLSIGSPTNAQNAAQVQALTKQCNGLIRLLINALDSTSGT